jgi:hypothetical protein
MSQQPYFGQSDLQKKPDEDTSLSFQQISFHMRLQKANPGF